MSKVKNLLAKMLLRRSSKGSHSHSSGSNYGNNNYCHYKSLEEIAQNQANERMLLAAEMATQQVLCCLETADGSFYWHAQ